jgi:hypothetical protein
MKKMLAIIFLPRGLADPHVRRRLRLAPQPAAGVDRPEPLSPRPLG